MLHSKPPITADETNRKGVHVCMHIIASKPDQYIGAQVFYKKPTQLECQRCDWIRKLNRGNVYVYVLGKGDMLTDEYCRTLAAAWLDRVQPWVFIDLANMTVEQYPAQRTDQDDEIDGIPAWLRDLGKECSNGLL